MRLKPASGFLAVAILLLVLLHLAHGQVGPDIDSIRANQKAAAEARQKEQEKDRAQRDTVRQESEQRLRAEVRAEVSASTQATADSNAQLQTEVARLRSELSDAKRQIQSLTSERDEFRRALDATTRPASSK